jgi:hypothetical protein
MKNKIPHQNENSERRHEPASVIGRVHDQEDDEGDAHDDVDDA